MSDPLSPEDRALYEAFFDAYREKHIELVAAAGDGAEISLDVCTVHAIRAMIAQETEPMRAAVVEQNDLLRSAYQVAERRGSNTDWISLFNQISNCLSAHHHVTNAARAPRVVSAVGVGRAVRPPEGK